ncbi:MAG: hypothetical protein ACI8TP_003177 [Acidimicrobiales bacterium]|jgi:hypothetical protein
MRTSDDGDEDVDVDEDVVDGSGVFTEISGLGQGWGGHGSANGPNRISDRCSS